MYFGAALPGIGVFYELVFNGIRPQGSAVPADGRIENSLVNKVLGYNLCGSDLFRGYYLIGCFAHRGGPVRLWISQLGDDGRSNTAVSSRTHPNASEFIP